MKQAPTPNAAKTLTVSTARYKAIRYYVKHLADPTKKYATAEEQEYAKRSIVLIGQMGLRVDTDRLLSEQAAYAKFGTDEVQGIHCYTHLLPVTKATTQA